jgi:DNA-binding MarR family transcriptional regulator
MTSVSTPLSTSDRPSAAADTPAASTPDPAALFDDERLTLAGLLAEAWTSLSARAALQLAGHGMSPVEFEVMIRLARSPLGSLRMTDLSAQTSLTTSGVTRVVDRLQDRGLVAREACLTDRRTTYAVISQAGRDLLAAALPGHLELIETWLVAPLRGPDGEAGLEAFVASLRRLRDHLAPCATAGSTRVPPAELVPEVARPA